MIDGNSILTGVIGSPINHTQSPRIHNYWLNHYKINGAYLPLHVSNENLEQTVKLLPKIGFKGFNVTLPHKENIIPYLDTIDPIAIKIGAVNTITVNKSGNLFGFNTDGYGFLENIRKNVTDWNPKRTIVSLIGAGGAARAIIISLIESGVQEIRLFNRTYDRAKKLAKHVDGPIKVLKWDDLERGIIGSNLLVNTTSLGMRGMPPLCIELSSFSSELIVADIVYSPLRTPLLRQASNAGMRAIGGLGMLLYQACPGFNSWYGKKPEVSQHLEQSIILQMGLEN